LPNGAPDPLAAINAALPNPADKPTLAQTQNPPSSPETREGEAAGVSPAEIDVLTSLADRRDALQERQRELDTKANVLAAAEKRVDDKIAQLKALQTQIEALLGQRDAKETQQLDGLVRIYTAMKPKDAARIFASLNDEVRIGVAGRMKADAMAGIMSALPSDVAQKITVELASHYKMAPDAAATAAAMTAAPMPAPASTPAAAAATPPAAQPAAGAPAPAAQATAPPKPGG
jgi:flagellar motility protein MotE (MotC chaperone)